MKIPLEDKQIDRKTGKSVPGISMKSSRLGCSGGRPGWIISALLVYAEEEENAKLGPRERCVSVHLSMSLSGAVLVCGFLKGHLSSLESSLFVGWVPLADLLNEACDHQPHQVTKIWQWQKHLKPFYPL